MCMMIRRHDKDGQLRWSIPAIKRWSCTRVAMRQSNINACPQDKVPHQDLWFIDDVKNLMNHENWTPGKLDELFDREIDCGKIIL